MKWCFYCGFTSLPFSDWWFDLIASVIQVLHSWCSLSICVCFLCIQLCVIMVFNIWCWFILCHLCKKRWCTFSAANIWIEQLCDKIFRINSHFAANRKQKSISSIFVTFHQENEIEMKWSKTKFQSVWYPQKQLMLFWNTNEKKIS